MSITAARPMNSSANEHERRARIDALFAAHAADVYAFAARRSTRSIAEDVVSETFLVAWRRLESVPESSKPWLMAVARRVLANQRRSDGRQAALRSRLGANAPDARRRADVEQSDTSAVRAALAALAPAERDAITLIAWDGLDAEHAAVVLGCSRATFYVRLHRARKRLAAALHGQLHDEQQHDEQGVDQP